MPFQTQRYLSQQDTLEPTSGGTAKTQLGRTGYYARLRLAVRGEILTVVPPGAAYPFNFGIAALLERVTLRSNFTRAIFDVSGEGYHYLLAPHIGQGAHPHPQNNAYNAIAPGLVVADMIIPLVLNFRDSTGTIVGGNEESLFTLEVKRRADADLGITGWTTQPTVKAELEWFEGSDDPAMQPDTSWLHQIIEQTYIIPAKGKQRFAWERGGNVIGMYYGLGFGEIDTPSGVDGWDGYDHRYNQSLYPVTNRDPVFDDIDAMYRNVPRLPGTFALDYSAQAALWDLDQLRDMVLTDDIVDNNTIIDVNTDGATFGQLYVIRRQLVPITVPGAGTATGQLARGGR
jgi:hypothetical protein